MARLVEAIRNNNHDEFTPPFSPLNRIGRPALQIGVVAAIVTIVGLVLNLRHMEVFYRAYLFGYLFWFNMTAGCLGVLMMQHMTGGNWGMLIRRMTEAGSRLMPLATILFIPVLVGAKYLYPWMDRSNPEEWTGSKYTVYLNYGPWIIRAVIYFAIWNFLALVLNKWSERQDAGYMINMRRRFLRFSGVGTVVFAITVSLAAVDWAMSLDPHWFSTIYGMLFLAGQVLAVLAFCTVLLTYLGKYFPFSDFLKAEFFKDLGNLQLAFILFYMYISFSQFLIIWSANLPEEITWYIARTSHGWQFVSAALIVFHWALPFAFLLSRDLKRRPFLLARISIMIFIARIVEVYWLIAPNWGHSKFQYHGFSWLDVFPLLAIGGLWMWAFIREYKKRPVLPMGHPEVERLFAASSHGH